MDDPALLGRSRRPRSTSPARTLMGTWPVGAAADIAAIRADARRLCVREPAVTYPPGGPVLARASERLAVVVTELAANGLRHAAAPVTVTLCASARDWLVSVSDGSPALTPRLRPADLGRLGGHGLRLVATIAPTCGWYVRDERKIIWAEIPDQPPAGLLAVLAQP